MAFWQVSTLVFCRTAGAPGQLFAIQPERATPLEIDETVGAGSLNTTIANRVIVTWQHGEEQTGNVATLDLLLVERLN